MEKYLSIPVIDANGANSQDQLISIAGIRQVGQPTTTTVSINYLGGKTATLTWPAAYASPQLQLSVQLAVRDALNFDKENEQEETVNSIFQDTEESICEPKLWTETKDLLKEAMDQCKGGGGSSGSSSTSSFLELYQTTYNLNMKSIEKGPASHAANYIQKLNLPLVCPTFASYYDTNNKGSKRITSKDIATYIAQLSCAKEKTSDMPEKTYSSSVCSKYVTHLRTNMINRLQQLAILNAYPSDVGSLSGETFLKLLSTGKHDGDMEVYDFANDVCVRPGMGKYKSDTGAM